MIKDTVPEIRIWCHRERPRVYPAAAAVQDGSHLPRELSARLISLSDLLLSPRSTGHPFVLEHCASLLLFLVSGGRIHPQIQVFRPAA